ncbi:MAG: hypothetical protein F9B45_31025 [Phycisphaera sp. RhM]|nr:hypothetical protein [Phycisphaera sp. RhM]
MFCTIVLPVLAENSPAEKRESWKKQGQKKDGHGAGVQASAAHFAAPQRAGMRLKAGHQRALVSRLQPPVVAAEQ